MPQGDAVALRLLLLVSSMSRDAIEAQRDKSTLIYREATAPGLLLEMKLLRIIESTQSEYQKIDVLETYFGKVSRLVSYDLKVLTWFSTDPCN